MQFEKQLELERERVLTDRQRAVQEDTMFRIKMAEGLIARAETEELRRQYEQELTHIMHSALQRPQLAATVSASSSSGDSASPSSVPSNSGDS